MSAAAWGAAASRFDIEAQSLSGALAAFARQSGLQLVYYSELAGRLRSRGFKGSEDPEVVLATLLEGSGLSYALLDANTVVIEPSRSPSLVPEGPLAASEAVPPPVAPATGQPLSVGEAAEEVFVMARRRIENVQQVPVSVAALDTEQLEARSIDNTESLNRQLANVSVAGTNFFGRQSGLFRMRGIPGVAIYVDGVVQGGGAGALQNVVEVERIEILRGPQGTLFGKNAVGGAIQYFSQPPRDTAGARIKTTVGAFNRLDVTANVDLPLGDSLRTKLTGARLTRGGYLPSTTVSRRFGSQHDSVARAVVAWQPRESVSFNFSGDYTAQATNGNPSTVWTLNPVCAGDPVPANYLGGIPNNPCVYRAVGLAFPQEWNYGAREVLRTASDYEGPDLFTRAAAFKGDVEWRLGSAWMIKGLAGYRSVDSTGYADFDGTPYKLFDGQNYNERREESVELQAHYAGGRLRGTTGFYFYRDRTRGRRMNWLANDLDARVDPVLNAAAVAYFPQFGTADAAGPSVVDGLTYGRSGGWAVFAEWSADLASRLTLTAGARFNSDTIRTAAYPTLDRLDPRCCVPSFNVEAVGPAIANQSGAATFTELSPRLSLQYQWASGLMGYFTYSEGFGAGGFTGGNIPNRPNGGFASFGPELLSNYELGWRSVLFAGRLRFNASAFYGRYHDIQVSEEVIPRFPTTTNAGEATIRGVEFEGIWSPVPALAVNFGVGWLDTAYTDLGLVTNIRRDSPFAYAPRYSGSFGAQYQWALRGGGSLVLRGDYGWQDAVIATLDVNTGSVIPAYGLASARLTYRPPAARWDISAYATNLTDEFYRINGFFIPGDQIDNGTVGRPREWGITFGYSLH